MKALNKYLICIIGILIIVISFIYLLSYNYKLNKKLDTAISNTKAYEALYTEAKEENKVFKLTVEQLNYSKDSLINKLSETKKELKIKDKEIQQLQYLASQVHIRDTVTLRDTIFKENVKVDTSLVNRWYNIDLSLQYPNTISLDVKIPSEKTVLVYNRKETIDPPKKCWLGRLFQKKHIVTNVKVIEENPYIEETQTRIIEVSK